MGFLRCFFLERKLKKLEKRENALFQRINEIESENDQNKKLQLLGEVLSELKKIDEEHAKLLKETEREIREIEKVINNLKSF